MKLRHLLLIGSILFFGNTYAFQKKQIKIQMLVDQMTSEIKPLILQLEKEIRAVVGVDAELSFSININGADTLKAKQQYQQASQSSDIILSFGLANQVMLFRQKTFQRPTIVLGVDFGDFSSMYRPEEIPNHPNLIYLEHVQVNQGDLEVFQRLVPFRNIGIAAISFAYKNMPLDRIIKETLQRKNIQYQTISYSSVEDIIKQLDGIDALYLAEAFLLSNDEVKRLSQELIKRKMPSFTTSGVLDVELGLLATRSSLRRNTEIMRKISLIIGDIIESGVKSVARNGSRKIRSDKELTLNFNTSERLNVPIRYSSVANTQFVGEFRNVLTEKTYNLKEFMEEVLRNNKSLKVRAKDVQLAFQDLRSARSWILPSLSIAGSGTYTDPEVAKVSGGQSPEYRYSGNISLTQDILSPRGIITSRIQKDNTKVQKQTLASEKLDMLQIATQVYFNILLAKTSSQINMQNMETTKDNLRMAEQRFESGQTGKSDVLRFTSSLAQDIQSFIESINQLYLAYDQMKVLLGVPLDTELEVEDVSLEGGLLERYQYEQIRDLLDDPSSTQIFVEFLVQEAYKNSPELQSLKYNLAIAEASQSLAVYSRFVPTVTLQGQYSHEFHRAGEGVDYANIAPPRSNYSVGIQATLPLFQKNALSINYTIAKIQKEQIQENERLLRENMETNIRSAVYQVTDKIANLELSKVSEESSREGWELTQESYQRGAIDRVELIDAQTNYISSQLASASAVYQFFLSALALERQIGYFFLMHSEEENDQFRKAFLEYSEKKKRLR